MLKTNLSDKIQANTTQTNFTLSTGIVGLCCENTKDEQRTDAPRSRYELDEALINFRACLDKERFAQAIDILEELPLTPETEAMWQSLAETSMQGARGGTGSGERTREDGAPSPTACLGSACAAPGKNHPQSELEVRGVLKVAL